MLSKVFYLVLCHIVFGYSFQNSTENSIPKCSDFPLNICGENAVCINPKKNSYEFHLHGGAFCKCRSGSIGRPPNCNSLCGDECETGEYCDLNKKLCVRGCKSNGDCSQNEFCNSGKCKRGCSSDSNCMSKEYCNTRFEQGISLCTKGCRSHENCKPGYYCDEDFQECMKGNDVNPEITSTQVECHDHDDCLPDEYCSYSECRKGCKNDLSCNSDEYCNSEDHTCEEGCRDDNHCQLDEYCGDHKCTKGCRDDSNCQLGESCTGVSYVGRTCVEGCLRFEEMTERGPTIEFRGCIDICKRHDDCKFGEYCDFFISGKCQKGCRGHSACGSDEYCSSDRQCIKGCSGSKSCMPDEYCDYEIRECKKGCLNDKNCKTGEYCNEITGQCTSGCRYPYQSCKRKEICDPENHQCRVGCWRDSDCKPDEYCNSDAKKCSKLCVNSPCGKNSVCSGIRHRQYCSCINGYVPEAQTGCRPIGKNDVLSKMNSDCSSYSGINSKCTVMRYKIYCFCPFAEKDILNNPYLFCSFKMLEHMVPTQDFEISVQSVMALVRG